MSAPAVFAIVLYAIWLLIFFLLQGGSNRELADFWGAMLFIGPVAVIIVLTIGAWIERRLKRNR